MRHLDQQMASLRAQQASAWVTALTQSGAEPRAAFVNWLKESPLNVREFLMAYCLDQSLEHLDSERRFEIDSLMTQINPRVAAFPIDPVVTPAPAIRRSAARRAWPYGIAAGLAAFALAGWWAISATRIGWEEFRTGNGELGTLQLGDGSVVHLNAHSRIALKFSAGTRDVELLDGEALFEVHHDAGRPFRVFTHGTVIQDLGTRFNVYSRPDEVQVAVIEGSVEVSAADTATTSRPPAGALGSDDGKGATHHVLKANEEAHIDRGGAVTVGTVPDIADAIAWQERRLIYRKETLAHIVDDFNRYSGRRIRLEGNEVGQRSYTGVFDADDPDSLAQVLAHDPELQVERSGETIVVRAK
jgi:transmembrane sensor